MKVRNINNRVNNTSFKAKEFAVVDVAIKNITQSFKVYSLDYDDRVFLDNMASNIKLKSLTAGSGFKDGVLRTWKRIINNAVLMSGFTTPQKSFLFVKDNKPCGIISYKDMQDCYLDNVASWPVSKNKYVKYTGMSMLKFLFHNCEKNNVKRIGLDVVSNSRIDLDSFYSKFGFIKNLSSERTFLTDLYIPRGRMLEYSKQLDSFIKIKEIESSKSVDLKKITNINFT